MKLSTFLLLVPSLALAQPAPRAAPTPAPTPPDQPQPAAGGSPQWLPGVVDVTAAETAVPGKLTLTMARAVEIAQKPQPSLRQARAHDRGRRGPRRSVRRSPSIRRSRSAPSSARARARADACGDPTNGLCGGFFIRLVRHGLARERELADLRLRPDPREHPAPPRRTPTPRRPATRHTIARRPHATSRSRTSRRSRASGWSLVAEATVKSEEAHLDQAKRFVAAQAKDPIEVAQAQARAANAQSALAQAQSDEAVALANLRAAIGWLDPTRAPAVDPNWPTPAERGAAGPRARSSRPRASTAPRSSQLDKQIDAADASVTAAHAERRPMLVGERAASQWSPATDDSVAAAELERRPVAVVAAVRWRPQPRRRRRSRTRTSIVGAGPARRAARLADLGSSSPRARRSSRTARTSPPRPRPSPRRRPQLKLAEARYAQGLGSQIELADAQTAVTTAEGNLITAEWQLADAWATLRRAIGQL